MKNFYKIRHLQKKCFLGIYILVSIFIPLKMSFLRTRIFTEQFWRCSRPLPTLVFWLYVEKCLKFHIMRTNQLWLHTLVNYVVFTVKFPVFFRFYRSNNARNLKIKVPSERAPFFTPCRSYFVKIYKRSFFTKFLRKYP